MIKVFSVSLTEFFLEDVASKQKRAIISGPFGSNISKKYFKKTGVPVIRGNNLSLYYERFRDEGFVFVTEEKANKLNTYAIENDLVFTAVGTLGQLGIIHKKLKYDKYVISNKQLRVRLNLEKIDPVYAFYWFSSPWIRAIIKKRNVGSTVPLINLGIVRKLPILLPETIFEQKKIANVLSSLDSKIELNNKINTELEAMAKLLYDYWFVQFDFPDANGKPYKSSGGKMVFDEVLKREIPEGWEVKELSDIANITTGKLDSNAEVKGGKYPFFTCASNPTTIDHYAFDDNVILIAGNNAAGNFHINRYKGKFNAYQRTYIVTTKKARDLEYLFQVLKTEMKILKSQGKGSQTKFITLGMLTGIKVLSMSTEVMENFYQLTNPIFEKQINILFQNQHLSQLRDWLLPMLMNGQVKVK